MKKRILIIGPFGEVGGVKTHVDILKQILKLYALEIKVTQDAPFFQILKERVFFRPEVIVYNLSVYRNKVIRDFITRTIFFSKKKLHVVHLHGGKFSDIDFAKHLLWRKLLKFHFNRFDRIFCLTDEQYQAVKSSLKVPHKAKKIFNFVEIPEVKELDKNDEKLNLLYIGRLHPLKGIMTAVNAVRGVKDERLRFWIVGAGELENEIKQINDPRIIFVGKRIGMEKNAYLSRAHVFLLPSLAESFPYSLLEASAFGLALLSTSVGSIDQILFPEQNGFFVQPDDVDALKQRIEYFLDNRALVEKMGIASRQICQERFSLVKLQDIYRDLFKEWELHNTN